MKERDDLPWLVILLAALSCTVPQPPMDGKSCDSAQRCLDGYTCVAGLCVSGHPSPPPQSQAAPPRGLCSVDGWCFEQPVPQGQILRAGIAASRTEVYAAGNGGTVLRYDGQTWSREDTPTRATLRGMWMDDAGTRWVVGDEGTILRRTEASGAWAKVDSPTQLRLNAVSGSGPDDVVAVGEQGTVLSWNGASWSSVDAGTQASLKSVWSAGSDDHWMVGEGGTALHWVEPTFEPHSFTTSDLNGISGVPGSDLWVVGNSGAHFRWTGGTWQPVDSNTPHHLLAVWAANNRSVFVSAGGVGFPTSLVWNGSSWQEKYPASDLSLPLALTGTAPDDVWLFGQHGVIRHFDGAVWEMRSEDVPGYISDIWGTSPLNVWTVDSFFGVVRRFDGQQWTRVHLPPDLDESHPTAVFGFSAEDVWFGTGTGQLLRFRGLGIEAVTMEFVVPPLRALWGAAPDDIWAVGNSGTLLRYRGERWRLQGSGTERNLNGIWGSASNDVWTAGDLGTLLHFDGSAWKAVPSGTSAHLLDISGSAANDVWAVGVGVFLHYDGTQWRSVPGAEGLQVNGVWAASPQEAYAATEDGKVLHWNGTVWTLKESGTDSISLSDVTGFGPGDPWVVGNQGTVLRRKPAR
ncbi:hypothetical protein [Myxococcus sp. RHSTA-1-4]|uniref:WD40/YVTN/BNR-like repeat-containing protein n=1 Tax=Myxococcus sp. RHSTA-1-4 TaxID=2874601 RepID=UPI001CBB71E3|nr:hypothetical protein [Myxococcus sp. RHSTA-1-4]MBZ4422498.1 hypothetical protein [Myxococcus sp. RHSTA-1-4]